MPDESIDLVITSPPYNVGIKYEASDDKYPLAKYQEFANDIMAFVSRVLKIGGRACFEIGGSGRNMPLTWLWQNAAYNQGLGLYSEITIAHRKTNPTAWGSYLRADCVFTIPNFHMLYVFYKESERKSGGITTITKDEWVEWTRGRWQVSYTRNKKYPHPAPFPISLPTRCIRLFGHIDDMILDPFMGSGTTAVASLQQRRNFIGFELSNEYTKMAQNRTQETQLPLLTCDESSC